MEEAAKKSNLLWKDETTVKRNIYNIASNFRHIWFDELKSSEWINYDNFKIAFKRHCDSLFSYLLENSEKEYTKNPSKTIEYFEKMVEDYDQTFDKETIESKNILDGILFTLRHLSLVMSIAKWNDKQKSNEIFDKLANVYERLDNSKEAIIEDTQTQIIETL
jgi:hypothetical protein